MMELENEEIVPAPKPTMLQPKWDGMPNELKQMKVWLVWRLEYRPGMTKPWTKVPYEQRGGDSLRASSTDPTTWHSYETARFLFESSDYDGVGIVLRGDIVGIDLDNCRDPSTGELTATAQGIVSTVNSYTEISPSGTGVKILCRGAIPGPRNRNQALGIELYHCGSPRYFTITGHHLAGTPTTIEKRGDAVAEVYVLYLRVLEDKGDSKPAVVAATSDMDVEEIVTLASSAANGEKFSKLWAGEWAGDYRSQSEADLALCSMLSFYAGNDPVLVDRAFRVSGLMRDKWERDDYRERTLGMARADEVYGGGSNGGITEAELHEAMKRAATPVIVASRPVDGQFADIDAAVQASVKKPAKKEKLTQPQQLIELAADGAELWHTPDQVAYATVRVGLHHENWRVKSTQFRQWLIGRHWDVLEREAGEKAIKSALEIIEHKALGGPTQEVHLRLARVGDTIYWDLANDAWECVEITEAGWKVVANPPVKFRRTGQTAPLPHPSAGGSLDALRPLVRPDDDCWILVKGFILDCLKGRGPYQIMVITGEQGSAKSTLARLVKQLIDPVRKAPLCSLPQKEENLGIDGESELVLAYDNVSHLSGWLSDAFCRLATGGGIKTRALYTNSEQYVVGFCRPLILNGIPDFAENQDLLSRSILVTQPTIPPAERRTEEDLMGQFDQAKPAILGALCDLVAGGLGRIGTTKLDRLPRMADSAKWITACIGNDSYLERAAQSERDGIEAALEASHTAMTLKLFLAGRTQLDIEPNELLRKLRDTAMVECLTITLPQNARTLSSRLRRDAPAMREIWGIDVQRTIKSHGKRLIRIRPWGTQKDTPSGSAGDATGDAN